MYALLCEGQCRSEAGTNAGGVMSSDGGGVDRELERRSFLRAMALGGAALSSGGVTGCVRSALQSAPSARVAPERAEREATRVADALAQLDTRMEEGRHLYTADGFGVDDGFSPRALRALTYTGLVLDLPEEVRHSEPLVHLGSQMEEELDQTMMDALWVLAHSGDDARERFDHVVRSDPGFVMSYAEQLDLGGAQQGLARGSRMRLRRVATEISSRLRVESADTMLTDVTSKMTRVMESSGKQAAQKRLAVTQATLEIFAMPQGATALTAPHAAALTAPHAPPQTTPHAPPNELRRIPVSRSDQRLLEYSVEHWDRRFRRRRTTTATLVGGGALTLGIGLAIVAGGSLNGLPLVTIGGVALLLSLVIGGLTLRARRNVRRRVELEPPPRP